MEPAETLRPNSPEITKPHKSKKPLRQPTKLPEKYELFFGLYGDLIGLFVLAFN